MVHLEQRQRPALVLRTKTIGDDRLVPDMEGAGVEDVARHRVVALGQRQSLDPHPVAPHTGAGSGRQSVDKGRHRHHPGPVAAIERHADVEAALRVHSFPLQLHHQLHTRCVGLRRFAVGAEDPDAANPRLLAVRSGIFDAAILGLGVEASFFAGDQELLVGVDHLLGRTVHLDTAVAQPQCAPAEERHVVHGVRAEEDGRAAVVDLADPVDALLLEIAVTDRQRLVHHQHIGVDVGGHRKGQPHGHPGRVALDGVVDEVAELGEVDDVVEPRLIPPDRDP